MQGGQQQGTACNKPAQAAVVSGRGMQQGAGQQRKRRTAGTMPSRYGVPLSDGESDGDEAAMAADVGALGGELRSGTRHSKRRCPAGRFSVPQDSSGDEADDDAGEGAHPAAAAPSTGTNSTTATPAGTSSRAATGAAPGAPTAATACAPKRRFKPTIPGSKSRQQGSSLPPSALTARPRPDPAAAQAAAQQHPPAQATQQPQPAHQQQQAGGQEAPTAAQPRRMGGLRHLQRLRKRWQTAGGADGRGEGRPYGPIQQHSGAKRPAWLVAAAEAGLSPAQLDEQPHLLAAAVPKRQRSRPHLQGNNAHDAADSGVPQSEGRA